MTRQTGQGDVQVTEKRVDKDDFDETSDFCDFGYVLTAPAKVSDTAQSAPKHPT